MAIFWTSISSDNRSQVGLNFDNFSVWLYKAEIWWRDVFLNRKFKFLPKTIDQGQFDVKNVSFYGFLISFYPCTF